MRLIRTGAELAALARRLGSEPLLAVDTEAASFHRYFDRVYLLQISSREETAVVVDGPVHWVWKRERRMSWRGKDVLHRERFFLARTRQTEIDTSGLDERERSWTLGHRWWSVDDIAASPERFEPMTLAVELKALLRDGPPTEPITIL